METPAPGMLLLATVAISDGVFDQSVVLLLDADEAGALGVVLNRVSEYDLEEALPRWKELCSSPARLFDGGPVSRNGAICLASPREPGTEPAGWRRLFGEVGLLHLDTPIELIEDAFDDLRIFAGYAGWDAGQLEGELFRGSWYVTSARHSDVFDPDPTTLWRRTVHRQVSDVAIYATWPDNPELN